MQPVSAFRAGVDEAAEAIRDFFSGHAAATQTNT